MTNLPSSPTPLSSAATRFQQRNYTFTASYLYLFPEAKSMADTDTRNPVSGTTDTPPSSSRSPTSETAALSLPSPGTSPVPTESRSPTETNFRTISLRQLDRTRLLSARLRWGECVACSCKVEGRPAPVVARDPPPGIPGSAVLNPSCPTWSLRCPHYEGAEWCNLACAQAGEQRFAPLCASVDPVLLHGS
jgi:hypothetical protein